MAFVPIGGCFMGGSFRHDSREREDREISLGSPNSPCASPISAPNRGAAVNSRRVHIASNGENDEEDC